jgi:DNA-binding MarR family transcriptional regulator
VIDPTFWLGLGTGLAASVVGGLVLWWFFGRARTPTRSPPARPGDAPPTTSVEAGRPSEANLLREPHPTTPVGPEMPPTGPRGYPRPEIGKPSRWEDGLRSSERILLHIARQGAVGPEEVAPRALCQAGMIEALGVKQGALTGVLRRLVSARVLQESREHVRGMDRRVKVYRLTPAGDRLILQLRTRRPTGAPTDPGPREASGREAPLPRVQIVPPTEGTPAPRT